MSLAYARNGLLGVLTPQANTTVEPEFSILLPPGAAMLTARLVSNKPKLNERLVDYVAGLDATCVQFANAPLGAFAFACTGSSYLIGPEAEDEAVARLSTRFMPWPRAMPAPPLPPCRARGRRRLSCWVPACRPSAPFWRRRK